MSGSPVWARSAVPSTTSSAKRHLPTDDVAPLPRCRPVSPRPGSDRAVSEKRTGRRSTSVADMLTSLTISQIFVLDQDQALDFYVNTLGLQVQTDHDLGFMRWLTVNVPG